PKYAHALGFGVMRVNSVMDSPGVTVRTINPGHGRGPVYYASLPVTHKGHGTNEDEAKQHLVSTLWDHLAALESPLRNGCQFSNRAAFPIRVERGVLGRPRLLLGEYRGPAISFSEGGGSVWAALCGDESDIGIDVAGSDEFRG